MTAVAPFLAQATFASPLGALLIQFHPNAIIGLSYNRPDSALPHQKLPPAWQRALSDYFAGEFDALDRLPIQLTHGTAFQQSVWLATRQIPAGKTRSYQELAQKIGRPKAYRAVGQALRCNPIAIILPCHRIVRQSGDIGGYAGQTATGTARKHFLLWHEGSREASYLPSKLPASAAH